MTHPVWVRENRKVGRKFWLLQLLSNAVRASMGTDGMCRASWRPVQKIGIIRTPDSKGDKGEPVWVWYIDPCLHNQLLQVRGYSVKLFFSHLLEAKPTNRWWETFDKSKTKTEQKLNKLQILVPTLWFTLSDSGRVVKSDENFDCSNCFQTQLELQRAPMEFAGRHNGLSKKSG